MRGRRAGPFRLAGWLGLFPVSRTVLDATVDLRARHRSLKTPDAIHLASAALAGCDRFLPNDKALQDFAGLRVEVMAG